MICPYCKEEIQEGATKCKHCGSLIIQSGGGGARSLTLKQFLFSFQGRITRSSYWLKYYLPSTAIYLALLLLDIAFDTYDSEASVGLFTGIFVILSIWPALAVTIKRAHDRNRSGWFLLLMLIPIINIWPAIELGLLRGTVGENRYGSDPLGA